MKFAFLGVAALASECCQPDNAAFDQFCANPAISAGSACDTVGQCCQAYDTNGPGDYVCCAAGETCQDCAPGDNCDFLAGNTKACKATPQPTAATPQPTDGSASDGSSDSSSDDDDTSCPVCCMGSALKDVLCATETASGINENCCPYERGACCSVDGSNAAGTFSCCSSPANCVVDQLLFTQYCDDAAPPTSEPTTAEPTDAPAPSAAKVKDDDDDNDWILLYWLFGGSNSFFGR